MYTLDIQLYNNVQSQKTTYFSKLFFFGTRRPLHRLEQFYLSALLTRQEMTKKCSPARSSLSSWFAAWGKKKKKLKIRRCGGIRTMCQETERGRGVPNESSEQTAAEAHWDGFYFWSIPQQVRNKIT